LISIIAIELSIWGAGKVQRQDQTFGYYPQLLQFTFSSIVQNASAASKHA